MQRRKFSLNALALLVAAPTLATLTACQKKAAETPAASSETATPAAPAAATGDSATPSTPAAPQNAYTRAATGQGFSTGPMMSAHTVYVFFDTTCPHCAHLWTNAQSLGGQLKIVWMPVGLLRPQSGPQGATILAAASPAAAMAENEASVLAHGSGISVPNGLDESAVEKVKANTALFRQFGSDSVPLIVYRNARTGEVGQQDGAVSADELLKLAGI